MLVTELANEWFNLLIFLLCSMLFMLVRVRMKITYGIQCWGLMHWNWVWCKRPIKPHSTYLYSTILRGNLILMYGCFNYIIDHALDFECENEVFQWDKFYKYNSPHDVFGRLAFWTAATGLADGSGMAGGCWRRLDCWDRSGWVESIPGRADEEWDSRPRHIAFGSCMERSTLVDIDCGWIGMELDWTRSRGSVPSWCRCWVAIRLMAWWIHCLGLLIRVGWHSINCCVRNHRWIVMWRLQLGSR